MRVSLDGGRVIKISFAYSSHNGVTPEDAGPFRRGLDEMARDMNRRLSYAEVALVTPPSADGQPEGYTPLASGIAVCHEKDTFVRVKGRKAATTKALEAASHPDVVGALTVADRKKVWKQYEASFGLDTDVSPKRRKNK